MTMTKKEKEVFETLLTAAALRATGEILPDVPPPDSHSKEFSKGWTFVGEKSDFGRVEAACSSYGFHGTGQQDKTNSQGSKSLYSTKLLALKALRHAVERDCAERLRRVDRMIEEGCDDE